MSMKMITSIPGVNDLIARINEELPPEIRLWGTVCRAPFPACHQRLKITISGARAELVQREIVSFTPEVRLMHPNAL